MSAVSDVSRPENASLFPPSVEDVVRLIAARNAGGPEPILPKGPAARRVKGLIAELTSLLEARPARPAADDAAGEGLAESLAPGEGLSRLRAYATPMKIEDWAGAVAGPNEVARRVGVSRSTLHDWH